MKKTGWGPEKWYEIHTKTIDYSNEPNETENQEMKKYILNLYKTIGCSSCRMETFNYILKFESQLDIICLNRNNVFKFFVDFHNVINDKLHKPKVGYRQVYIMYQIDKIYRNLKIT